MKYFKGTLTLIFLLSCFNKQLFSQKMLVDSTTYNKWPAVNGTPSISNDGKYIMYRLKGSGLNDTKLVLQAITSKWNREIANINDGNFSEDSKKFFFIKSDTLNVFTLGTSLVEKIANVSSYELKNSSGYNFLIYQSADSNQKMTLRDLNSGKERSFLSVRGYWFSNNCQNLALLKSTTDGIIYSESLVWISLRDYHNKTIWIGNKAENIVFSNTGSQIAFTSSNVNNGSLQKAIYYYKNGMQTSISLTSDTSLLSYNGLKLDMVNRFSKDDNRLFLTYKGNNHFSSKKGIVDVWSYIDPKLQSEQLMENNTPRSYVAVINISSRHIIRLEDEFESIDDLGIRGDDDYLIVNKATNFSGSEVNWNSTCQKSSYLVSTINGAHRRLNFADSTQRGFGVSRYGKYLVYWDKRTGSYFTYEISSGLARNITGSIDFRVDVVNGAIKGWVGNDDAIIFNYENDVWLLDPKGEKKPINLTNGMGHKNGIEFSILYPDDLQLNPDKKEKVFFTAFNKRTKENGFYAKTLGKMVDPDSLIMGPYIYHISDNGEIPYSSNMLPVKAGKVSVYVVKRLSAKESPNYYITSDFRSFKLVTNIHPERKYNWYTTELHTWTSLDGSSLEGILYKPENFDASKKYPVIFHYYERMSSKLNLYIDPEPLTGFCNINIPSYVSKGYLVFCPDIHYKIGDPMQGTYDAVISAAEYLSKKQFVDPNRMGLEGASWGGIQTNYLVTHTNLFAAACSGLGMGDWISGYGDLFSDGRSRQAMFEYGQSRVGASLWEKPNIYLKNSAVLSADKVTTPLLLMNGKNDGICHFYNIVEFFTGLRRLGKRSWMLAYDEGHGLDGKNADDFSIRMMQFFDHYLMNKPAPIWMLDGIPASKKGFDDGLRLDTTGRTPGRGLLTKKEQVKVDSLLTKRR